MKNLGKITTPKRKIYFFRRKLEKHQDIMFISFGIIIGILLIVLIKLLK
jgi:hypothetical protein